MNKPMHHLINIKALSVLLHIVWLEENGSGRGFYESFLFGSTFCRRGEQITFSVNFDFFRILEDLEGKEAEVKIL
jgi:hypothetical protein